MAKKKGNRAARRQAQAAAKARSTGNNLMAIMETASAQMATTRQSPFEDDEKVKLSKAEKQALLLFRGAADRNNRPRRIGADLGGGGLALLSGEAIAAGVRWVSQYSTWVADRVDYFQAAPQALIGLVAYWAEMWMRTPQDVIAPTFTREIGREWAKALATVGLANMWRAFTVRGAEKSKKLAATAAVEAERDALRAQLEQLLKKG